MNSVARVVRVAFWEDSVVTDCFSTDEKLFFLYLLTNPHTTQLGIYQIAKKQMSYEIGFDGKTIDELLSRFQNDYGMIRYSERTREIAIKNYLRHGIIKGGKPVEDLLKKEISQVKDKTLLQFVYDAILPRANLLTDSARAILPYLNQNNQ